MKKISKTMAFLASSSVLLLAACGETTDNTVETDPADSSPVENNQSATPTDYGFTSFDLSIDTPDERDAIDVDYETGRSGTEIEYQNVLEDVNLGGDEAGTALEPIFTNLNLTADMAKEDVLSTVTEAFGVTEYRDFELEVEFEDGKEVKWEDTK
ncbi:hypothetical protein CQS04_06200 [Chryseomicrobium excrementi]|uniref:YusW-like protein n=1 Tax=Chryseomicrobium excrementi TaxID=2041346 RepID=A0A2M9EZV0_9BACL|nr:YusW family protein [Chryseomicrobium excrementi]PJK16741.1 hypothetical protein CQS04_06200 [Chryseomicrobium excrementi]